MTFTTIYTFYISFTKYYMDMAYGHTLTAKSLFRKLPSRGRRERERARGENEKLKQ